MITIKRVVIDGNPLLEVVSQDKATEQLPTVVFYHGWTNYKESVLVNGYELAKRGMRALLPDAYLHGERMEMPLVEEAFSEFWNIVTHNLKDLPGIRDYYVEAGLSDPNRFGVTGLSMGGITTCGALTCYPWIKAAVCLMGSPEPIQFSHWLLSSSWAEGLSVPEKYLTKLQELEPIDLSCQPEKIAGRPVHFWHGTSDTMVPYQPTFDFYQKIKEENFAKNVSFTTTEGVGHKVPYLTSVEMADFFAEHI